MSGSIRSSLLRASGIRNESGKSRLKRPAAVAPGGSRTANRVVPYEANTGGTLCANMVATMGRTMTGGEAAGGSTRFRGGAIFARR